MLGSYGAYLSGVQMSTYHMYSRDRMPRDLSGVFVLQLSDASRFLQGGSATEVVQMAAKLERDIHTRWIVGGTCPRSEVLEVVPKDLLARFIGVVGGQRLVCRTAMGSKRVARWLVFCDFVREVEAHGAGANVFARADLKNVRHVVVRRPDPATFPFVSNAKGARSVQIMGLSGPAEDAPLAWISKTFERLPLLNAVSIVDLDLSDGVDGGGDGGTRKRRRTSRESKIASSGQWTKFVTAATGLTKLQVQSYRQTAVCVSGMSCAINKLSALTSLEMVAGFGERAFARPDFGSLPSLLVLRATLETADGLQSAPKLIDASVVLRPLDDRVEKEGRRLSRVLSGMNAVRRFAVDAPTRMWEEVSLTTGTYCGATSLLTLDTRSWWFPSGASNSGGAPSRAIGRLVASSFGLDRSSSNGKVLLAGTRALGGDADGLCLSLSCAGFGSLRLSVPSTARLADIASVSNAASSAGIAFSTAPVRYI